MREDTSEADRFLQNTVYAVLGFGAIPLDFARRLISLSKENPAEYALLHDVTDRVAFVDRLRFEAGWEADYDETGTYTPAFAANLDALETYLLCTCIDALANAQSPASFLDWAKQNHDTVCELIGGEATPSAEAFVNTIERLHSSYKQAGAGLTRNFIGFFVDLPSFLRRAFADTFVLIKGSVWDKECQNRLERWKKFTQEERIKRIARDYLWKIRRSEYTHLSRWHRAASPGHWRRLSDAGAAPELDGDGERWQRITFEKRIRQTKGDFYKIRDNYKVQCTLFRREPSDEGFLLRAVIATSMLRRMLRYLPDEKYLQQLLRYYAAREALYAFLHEMQQNRDYIDLLVSSEAVTANNYSLDLPVGEFSTYAGEHLLRAFSGFVEGLKRDIASYIYWLNELNKRITQLNTDYPPETTEWRDRKPALVRFSQTLRGSPEIGQLLGYHRWVYSNLRYHVESGQIHYRFGGLLLSLRWSDVWEELRTNLRDQPLCPTRPVFPSVRTLAQGVINDIIEIGEQGVTVRSHRTLRKRFIRSAQFEAWWNHLLSVGSASLTSRSQNIPRTGHARVVGALIAAGLPNRIRVVDHNTIELIR